MFIFSIILLQIFIFAGLAFFLRHLLTRNVSSATSHLQGMIKDNTEKQEEVKKQLEDAQKQAKETIKDAEKEAEDLKEKLRKGLEDERDKIVSEAHMHSEEVLERANKTVQARRDELEKEINLKAIEHSGELICKVLPLDTCRMIHGNWVQSLINEGLESLDRLRVPEDVAMAKVHTAFSLTDEEKAQLQQHLKEKLYRDIGIEEETKPELIAGIVIVLGNLIFDGSFANKIQEVARESTSDSK